MYPGHVAGLKKLHRSAVITIVLSKDSRWRKQGHWGGNTDVLDPSGGGKGPFWGRWPLDLQKSGFPCWFVFLVGRGENHFLLPPRSKLKSIISSFVHGERRDK